MQEHVPARNETLQSGSYMADMQTVHARTNRLPVPSRLEVKMPVPSLPIWVLNGPNLNMLGTRQPEIYGYATLADVEGLCRATAADLGTSIAFWQSNAEHQLIDWIHQAREQACAIIINAAALTHTSVAVLDALNIFEGPVIEVHLSNIHKREAFRHHSYVSARADGVIVGCGANGYALAVRQAVHMLAAR
jgi:3-dehydroquinate dehydratase-2